VPVLLMRDVSTASPPERAPLFSDVLIPLASGDDGEEIIRDTMAIAGEGATLHLLQVVVPVWLLPPPSIFDLTVDEGAHTVPADLLGASRDAAHARLEQIAERLRARGIATRSYVRIHPHPAEAVLALSDEVSARLIAIAAHRRGAARMLLGSVTDKVVRGATVPVLVRPPHD
jgi:nucleotide-binding universal stress UspA family protein